MHQDQDMVPSTEWTLYNEDILTTKDRAIPWTNLSTERERLGQSVLHNMGGDACKFKTVKEYSFYQH